MHVEKDIFNEILRGLRNAYPDMMCGVLYQTYEAQFGEKTLDAHLLYLWEKGLITTQMKYDYLEPFSPVREQGSWHVSTELTRINAAGLDYLDSLGL